MLRIKVKKRFPSRSNFYHYCLSRNIEIRNFFPVQTGILERLVLGKNIKRYLFMHSLVRCVTGQVT